MYLCYRLFAFDETSFQLRDVTDFKIGDDVYIGRADGSYFIVDRSRNVYELYTTVAQRDKALAAKYGVAPSDLWEMPWYASLRANALYPWNLLYYGVVLTGIVIHHRWRKRRSVRDRRPHQPPDGDEGNAAGQR